MTVTISSYKRNIGLLAIILFLSILVVLSFSSYKEKLKIIESNVVSLNDLRIYREVNDNTIKIYGDIKLENCSKDFYCILFDTNKNNYIRLKTEVSLKVDNVYSYEASIKIDKLNKEGNYMVCFGTDVNNKDTIIKTDYIIYSQGNLVEEK